MELLKIEEPLEKIKCLSTNCEGDKHCFRPKRAKPETLEGGPCHACKAEKVDWGIAHQRDLKLADQLFEMMRHENIRHHFWTIDISEKAVSKITGKTTVEIKQLVRKRLESSAFKAGRDHFRDGIQTPTTQHNILLFAQHATGTCCRKCIKYWHGVPYERPLNEKELLYFIDLIMLYIEHRLSLEPNSNLTN